MEKNKLIIVDVDVTTSITSMRDTQAVIYSHDEQAPQLQFNITKNGSKLTDATNVSLLLSSANYRGYVREGLSIKLDASLVDSTVTFDLPSDLLRYQGYVRADLYLDWQDGSNDTGQPVIFEVKKSTIDAQASVLSYVYISDFEIAKQEVSQAAQEAIDTINTDEQAVKQAKDEAITEIHARPSELDASISQARQIITNRPTELDEPIAQAKQAIDEKVGSVKDDEANQTIANKVAYVTTTSNNANQTITNAMTNVQTVASAETGKIQQKASEANKDIDDVKINAIATINSQTDLSSEVTTARSAIAKSASDTQVVADNATTAINKVVTDTQTLGQAESTKITAVLPTLQTQISDTQANAQAIKEQLETGTALAGIKLAWANSADGVTDFSKYPMQSNYVANSNFELGSNKLQSWTIASNANVTASGNEATLNNTPIGSFYQIVPLIESGKKYTVSFDAYADTDNVTLQSQPFGGKGATNFKLTQSKKRYSLVVTIGTNPNIYFGIVNNSGIAHISKIKLEDGEILTPYIKRDAELTSALDKILKYKGISNIDSTNPNDYKWSQSDEYRDYKEDKLTQAIIALGGTV